MIPQYNITHVNLSARIFSKFGNIFFTHPPSLSLALVCILPLTFSQEIYINTVHIIAQEWHMSHIILKIRLLFTDITTNKRVPIWAVLLSNQTHGVIRYTLLSRFHYQTLLAYNYMWHSPFDVSSIVSLNVDGDSTSCGTMINPSSTTASRRLSQNNHFKKRKYASTAEPNWPKLRRGRCNGPLTRYVKSRVGHAPGMPGTFSPPPTSKETAS